MKADETPEAHGDEASGKEDDQTRSSKAPEAQAGWEYNTASKAPDEQEEPSSNFVPPVSWSASEYIAHQKNAGWFLTVLLVVFGVAGLVYLLTRELVSTLVIAVIGIAFTAFAGRQPQTLEYSLDGTGLHISNRTYLYGRFRSFAILSDEPIPTIMFIPMRRFDLPISIHFDEADADKIIDMLGTHLPGEETAAPFIDRLMSKIHF